MKSALKAYRKFIAAAVAVLALCASHRAVAQPTHTFDTAPSDWRVVGDTNLFQWNPAAKAIDVTWDSSKANSYLALPLGRTLTRAHSFTVAFDLFLRDAKAGVTPGKLNPFQLSAGFIELASASRTNFYRGSGTDSPNLVEFSYFPDPSGEWMWGPSLTSVLIDATGTNWSSMGFLPLALESGTTYRVTMTYDASQQNLRTVVLTNGQVFATLDGAKPTSAFTDFRVDHFAIMSYSEAGQDPAYAGSLLAHGTVDNVAITLPIVQISPISRIQGKFEAGKWVVRFLGAAGWRFTLERATGLTNWEPAGLPVTGSAGAQQLEDAAPPLSSAFYRIKAEPL